MTSDDRRRLIVAVTGASGGHYAVRILQLLHAIPDYAAHLIISSAGAVTLRQEDPAQAYRPLIAGRRTYRDSDIGAAIASGSFPTNGMIVAPCSMKTLAAVANCDNSTLIGRAADVCLKEGRPLLLMVRETPCTRVTCASCCRRPRPGQSLRLRFRLSIPDRTPLPTSLITPRRRALQRVGVSALAPEPWTGLRSDVTALPPGDAPSVPHCKAERR